MPPLHQVRGHFRVVTRGVHAQRVCERRKALEETTLARALVATVASGVHGAVARVCFVAVAHEVRGHDDGGAHHRGERAHRSVGVAPHQLIYDLLICRLVPRLVALQRYAASMSGRNLHKQFI